MALIGIRRSRDLGFAYSIGMQEAHREIKTINHMHTIHVIFSKALKAFHHRS